MLWDHLLCFNFRERVTETTHSEDKDGKSLELLDNCISNEYNFCTLSDIVLSPTFPLEPNMLPFRVHSWEEGNNAGSK